MASVAGLAAGKNKRVQNQIRSAALQRQAAAERSAAIASGLGCWGTVLVFSVNSSKILQPSKLTTQQSGRWKKHNIPNAVPKTEFQGADSMGVTMTITLSAEHGVRPRAMLDYINACVRAGVTNYLAIGGEILGSGKMAITDASETWDEVMNKGELVRAKVSLTFQEYN